MPWSLGVVTSHGGESGYFTPKPSNMAIPNIQTSDFLPEKYSGEKKEYALSHWLSYIDYCETHGLNAGQRETQFKNTLKGPARI